MVVVISLFPWKRHSGSPENVGTSFSREGDGQQERKRVGESQAKRMFTKIIGFNLQSDTTAFIAVSQGNGKYIYPNIESNRSTWWIIYVKLSVHSQMLLKIVS